MWFVMLGQALFEKMGLSVVKYFSFGIRNHICPSTGLNTLRVVPRNSNCAR